MAVKYLKSMIKRVLSEGTSQRAGGGGMSAWRAVRNGFVRCVDELAVVYDAASRYRGRILIVSDNELSIQVAYPVRSATFFINITSMFINKGGTTVIRP